MKKYMGYVFAALSAAAYGTNPLFALNLYAEGMNANSVLIFRYLLGLPLIAAMIWARGRSLAIKKKEIGPAAVLGILMACSSLALFESYNYMNSGIASTLLFVYPIIVALLMVFFFHEKMKPVIGVCLAVMLAGLFLLIRNSEGTMLNPFGVLLVMASSLTYAVYIVMINVSDTVKTIPTLKLLFYTLLSGALVFIAVIPFGNPLTVPRSVTAWANVLGIAVVPTLISLSLTTAAIQSVGSTITAIFGALEPVTALLLSVLVLGQPLTGREILGIVLILIATTLVVIGSAVTNAVLRVRKMFPSLRRR